MEMRKRLSSETVSRLRQLARQFGLIGFLKLRKEELIDLIMAGNRSPEEINAALDKKLPWWKRITWGKLLAIIAVLGSLASILAIILSVHSCPAQTKRDNEWEKEKAANKYYRNLIEKQELSRQGFPNEYINGLGENVLLKHYLQKGQRLEKESQFKEAAEEFKKCLIHPAATNSNKVAAHILMGNCYYSLSAWKEAETHYKSALEMSEAVDENNEKLRGKSVALGNMGLIYQVLGEPRMALKYLQDALEIGRKIGFELSMASNLGNIGRIYQDLGDLQKALTYHQEALGIDRKIGYEQGVAANLGNIGLIYGDLGEPQKALKYHQEALEIDRKIGYDQGVAANLGNIGLIYYGLGELQKALKYHQEALEIYREIRYELGVANALENIGVTYYGRGEPQLALKYHQEALEIYRKIRYEFGVANALGNIGVIHISLGELQKALKYHEEALEIHRKRSYQLGVGSDLGNIGVVYYELGEPQQALRYLNDALTIFERIGAQPQIDIAKNAIKKIQERTK